LFRSDDSAFCTSLQHGYVLGTQNPEERPATDLRG
jgi:hypothetical protein